MSPADELERILPRLRGFARAVSGDPELADKSVERVLMQILSVMELGQNPMQKAFQYYVYHLLDRSLERLDPESPASLATRAIVLVEFEKFSPREAACILGTSTARIESFISMKRSDVFRNTSGRCALSQN
jgi:DNA-directed RNA polymerase specialized sigma24 family protein